MSLPSEEFRSTIISRTGLLLAVLSGGLVLSPSRAQETAPQHEFFETRIRPVLVRHCYSCHSAEAEEVKGGLRLDVAAGLLQGGDSGPALVPGKPSDSPLIEALRYDGMEMPPEGKLTDNVIRDFEKWVTMGAPDPRTGPVSDTPRRSIDIEQGRQFWAFQPFTDHVVPDTDGEHPRGSSIDAFVAARLRAAGLQPAVCADRATIVRRLCFDLTGLPPDTAELTAVVEDHSDSAIVSLVDTLLNSPEFGVHWARHWLDVARYADSNGGDFNATFHNAWKYRDYVVDSFNSDKPFNQFVREQIAGDLLPFTSDEQHAQQVIATGFLMVGTKMLSERDKLKLTMDVVDEQISTVGSAFMGLTLGCARCHDHKFDPIPTDDYYALAGIFRSTRTLEGESQKYVSTWRRTSLPTTPEHAAAVAASQAEKKNLEDKLARAKKQLTALEKQNRFDSRLVVDDAAAELTGKWTPSNLTPQFIGQGYLHDNREGKGEKSVEFVWTPPKSATWEVRLSYTAGSTRADNVPITIRHADGEADVVLDQTKPPAFDKKFTAVGRFRFNAETRATVRVSNAGTTGYVIVDAVQFVEIDENGKIIPADDAADPAVHQQVADQKDRVKSLEEELKRVQQDAPPPLPMAIATRDLTDVGDCEICVRGEHNNLGRKVPRGFLQVASSNPSPTINDDTSGRRELADWMADPQHPLTARVIVNRVWYHLLGEGIVRSVDNFGELGERPTHPELLDHLATRFVTPAGTQTEQGAPGFGWSLKALIREIVLSEVYQRSSQHNETSWQEDAENKLLWKAHRRRIPAESLRDAMLAISGQLNLSPGGSPVPGLGTLVKTNSADAEDYERQESQRRSLYLPIIRNELPRVLSVFDFADPDLVVGRRPVTNVPAQALFLLNSPFVMNCARETAAGLCRDQTQTFASLIAETYRTVLARQPAPAEIDQALEFLEVADRRMTIAAAESSQTDAAAELPVTRLARFVHVLFASTEFRMLN